MSPDERRERPSINGGQSLAPMGSRQNLLALRTQRRSPADLIHRRRGRVRSHPLRTVFGPLGRQRRNVGGCRIRWRLVTRTLGLPLVGRFRGAQRAAGVTCVAHIKQTDPDPKQRPTMPLSGSVSVFRGKKRPVRHIGQSPALAHILRVAAKPGSMATAASRPGSSSRPRFVLKQADWLT